MENGIVPVGVPGGILLTASESPISPIVLVRRTSTLQSTHWTHRADRRSTRVAAEFVLTCIMCRQIGGASLSLPVDSKYRVSSGRKRTGPQNDGAAPRRPRPLFVHTSTGEFYVAPRSAQTLQCPFDKLTMLQLCHFK